MWHIKIAVVFYYEAKIIIDMRKKLLTRGGVYILRDTQKGHKKTKNWPRTIFSPQIYSSMDKLLSFQEKKITNFFSIVRGKRRKNYYQSAVLFTDTQNNYETTLTYVYESAVSITSPPKTITGPLKEIKMIKTDPKKVPSQTGKKYNEFFVEVYQNIYIFICICVKKIW